MSNENMSWIEGVVDSLNAYEFEEKLPGSKRVVKFKASTPKHLKKILQYENTDDLEKIEDIIDSIINDSVVDESFNQDNLFIQDRFFLFFCIRLRSKGSVIESKETCSNCHSQYISQINLSDCECTELNPDLDTKLEISKKLSLELKILTRKDQKEIFESVRGIKDRKQKLLSLAINTYAAAIKSIKFDGKVHEELSLKDKVYFLERSPEEIFNKVKKWTEDNDFGVSLTLKKQCPHCGEEQVIEIDSSDLI